MEEVLLSPEDRYKVTFTNATIIKVTTLEPGLFDCLDDETITEKEIEEMYNRYYGYD